MSASREKKIRQELAQAGIPDIKDIRAKEEREKQRKANLLYGGIAIAFVVVAAALILWNSGVFQRNATALSIEGEKYSVSEVSYYYYNAFNTVANSNAASYLSLDPSKPANQQVMDETDYMFMGLTAEENEEYPTWHQYFMDVAKDNMIQVTMLCKAAKENNISWNDEMQDEYDATMESLKGYAKETGTSVSSYLKMVFGGDITLSTFKDILKDNVIASHYSASYAEKLSYSDDAIEKYYNENKDQFDVVDHEYIYFKATADATKDAEGNSVPATDDENAAAEAKAKAAAEDALERYENGESLEEIAKDYDIGTYSAQPTGSYYGDTISTWLFDADREAGDKTILNNSTYYYVVGFNSRGRQEYNTVNARHILVMLDTTGLDSTADDYATKLQAVKDAAKTEADKILQEYKDGEQTAEAFGALANKYSDDGGSNTVGGLYTQITKGYMVPEFNDWIFDESRQLGDTDIIFVESSNYSGYHVMYFDGVDLPYWKAQVENTLRNEEFTAWGEALVKDVTAEEHNGIKHVG